MKTNRTPGPGSDALNKALKNLNANDKVGKVGWIDKNQYPDSDTHVAQVAAQNEYGTGRIPARPFFRPAIKTNSQLWAKILEQGAKQVLKGELTIEQALATAAIRAEGDVRRAIADVYSPELSEVTKANRRKRGNDNTKPLVDTRYMINTLISRMEKE